MCWIVLKVGSSVAMPRISSTSFISGTGFMKCMPMNWPGRSVTEASRVIEIDEVLVQISASGFRCGQRSRRICFFSSSFSVADSITTSQPENMLISVPVSIRPSAFCFSSLLIFPLATWRSMFSSMVARDWSRRLSSTSESLTL